MNSGAIALVSGAGRAVIRDGDTFYVLTVGQPEPTLADATHWGHLRNLHPDSIVCAAGSYPYAAAREVLTTRWRRERAVDLVLLALSSEDDHRLRRNACQEAEKLLLHDDVLRTLRSALLGTAPPQDADYTGASAIAKTVGAERVHSLLKEVDEAKETIVKVKAAWKRTASVLPNPEDWVEATALLDQLHATAELVSAVRAGFSASERQRLIRWLAANSPVEFAPAIERWIEEVAPSPAARAARSPGIVGRTGRPGFSSLIAAKLAATIR